MVSIIEPLRSQIDCVDKQILVSYNTAHMVASERETEGRGGGIIPRSPEFHSNYPNTPFSTGPIIVELLQERDFPVDVADAVDDDGRPLPDYLAVYGSPQTREMLHRLYFTPEAKAITWLEDYAPPTFDGCGSWDSKTKRRLEALHWHLRAETADEWAMQSFTPASHKYYVDQQRRSEQRSRALLKSRNPFSKELTLPTRDEVKGLMRAVVEREYPSQIPTPIS